MLDMEKLTTKCILLVDDEQDILNLLETVLRREGFQHIYTAAAGSEALELCRREQPDLIVLDIMLPDTDGFTLCGQLRQETLAPIFFLSARSEDTDKIVGLTLGGDDYITKPFSPREVAVRIKAALRRREYSEMKVPAPRLPGFGDIQIDEQEGEVRKAGRVVPLTAKEYQLLVYLARHPGRVFSRVQLVEAVWGDSWMGFDNTLMVHMRHLREKLEDEPSDPKYLVTIRGLGYKLRLPEASS